MTPSHQTPLFEPPHALSDVVRYCAAMMIVSAVFAGIAGALGHPRSNWEASDIDSAVMVELPAAEASSHAADGEDRQEVAAAAAAAAQRPQRVETEPKPVDVPKPKAEPERKAETPPAPNPTAVLERKSETSTEPVVPPPSAAQAPQARSEAGTPVRGADNHGDEGAPHASAQAINAWQKALMRRLEGAKRGRRPGANGAGTVKVAFEIDRHGAIRAARVTAGSGSPSLDAAAMALVKDASPFPPPPAGAGDRNMSFVVPIRFR